MNVLIRVFLCLFGVFYTSEGFSNVFYWKNHESKRLFQLGRLLRGIFGLSLILIAVWGE